MPEKCPQCEASAGEHPEIKGGECSVCGTSWPLWECSRDGAQLVEKTFADLIGEDPPVLEPEMLAIVEEWREMGRDGDGRPLLTEQEAMLRRLEPLSASEREIRIALWRTLTAAQHEFTPDPETLAASRRAGAD